MTNRPLVLFFLTRDMTPNPPEDHVSEGVQDATFLTTTVMSFTEAVTSTLRL